MATGQLSAQRRPRQHLLRVIVVDLRLIAHHFVICRFQKLLSPVLQLLAYFLLLRAGRKVRAPLPAQLK